MRASPRLLADCEAELKQRPDHTGTALMKEYHTAVRTLDTAIDHCNYSQTTMARVLECSRRLKNWHEAKVKERTEKAKREVDW